jgi:hypothetical protein
MKSVYSTVWTGPLNEWSALCLLKVNDSSNTSGYKLIENTLPFSTYCITINLISNKNTAFTQMQEEVFSPLAIQCFTSAAVKWAKPS